MSCYQYNLVIGVVKWNLERFLEFYIPFLTALSALIASKIFSEYSVEKLFSQSSVVSDWI